MNFMAIHWAGTDYFITLPIFIVLIVGIIKNYLRLKKTVALLAHPTHQKTILKNFSLSKQRIKSIFLCLSLMSMFFALLQPQWGVKEQNVVQEGRDLMIVLDISKSMQAKDLKPSRLEFAKLKIRALLKKLKCERVGLIVFSGSAFVQCPLTSDYAAFLMFLDHVDSESLSSGTTNLGAAFSKVIDVFKSIPERKHKLALLLTDGEDFSINLESIKTNMTHEHIVLFSLGVATPEGAPIPKFDHHGNPVGHETDAQNNIVLSKLDEKTLSSIATSLNGHYLRAGYDDSDIDNIVKQVARYEKEKFTDRTLSHYHDQYPWFLGGALLFLALEWIL